MNNYHIIWEKIVRINVCKKKKDAAYPDMSGSELRYLYPRVSKPKGPWEEFAKITVLES